MAVGWTVREVEVAPKRGRWPAPRLQERAAKDRPVKKPYPVTRRYVRIAIVVVGVVLGTLLPAIEDVGLSLVVLSAWVAAVIVLPGWLVPSPYPAFLYVGERLACELQSGNWVREATGMNSGYAVEVVNVSVRFPDTVGDATPPVVVVRFSDDRLCQFRPQHSLHVVQPVDLRRKSA